MSLIRILLGCAICSLAAWGHAQSPPPTPLRLLAFDGGWNLPVWAAQRQGYFDAQGIAVQLSYTPNSAFLITSILDGRVDLALATVDNLVAGQHDATLLRTPFELLAVERGFKVIATAESLGAYQGTVGFTRRSFARDHEAALIGVLRAYRAAADWLYDRANRGVVEALLVANIRDMTPALAKRSYDLLLADKGSLTRDLAPDGEGMRAVLRLRSKYGTPPKTLTDVAKYIDPSYLEKAAARR